MENKKSIFSSFSQKNSDSFYDSSVLNSISEKISSLEKKINDISLALSEKKESDKLSQIAEKLEKIEFKKEDLEQIVKSELKDIYQDILKRIDESDKKNALTLKILDNLLAKLNVLSTIKEESGLPEEIEKKLKDFQKEIILQFPEFKEPDMSFVKKIEDKIDKLYDNLFSENEKNKFFHEELLAVKKSISGIQSSISEFDKNNSSSFSSLKEYHEESSDSFKDMIKILKNVESELKKLGESSNENKKLFSSLSEKILAETFKSNLDLSNNFDIKIKSMREDFAKELETLKNEYILRIFENISKEVDAQKDNYELNRLKNQMLIFSEHIGSVLKDLEVSGLNYASGIKGEALREGYYKIQGLKKNIDSFLETIITDKN